MHLTVNERTVRRPMDFLGETKLKRLDIFYFWKRLKL